MYPYRQSDVRWGASHDNIIALDAYNGDNKTDYNQWRFNENQHTYGAYTNSTLPRGPYLQYKYDRQAKSTADPRIDYDNLRRQQIEQLKKEFLPKCRDDAFRSATLRRIQSNHYLNYDTDDAALHVQTLGRYKKSAKSTNSGDKLLSATQFYAKSVQNPNYFHDYTARDALNGAANNYVKPNSKSDATNLVFLSEVIKIKPNGLTESEGWALLCQSVQALQDLFLLDIFNTNRIIPLIHPSILQITSRGRVIFSILPSGQMNSLNDITTHISFLPPEYLNNIGKKVSFNESDVEKMWIYSLGVTLRRAIHTFSEEPKSDESSDKLSACNQNAISLKYVIRAMCAPNIYCRASLMYLLDVISQYCRSYHQTKPFSHVVINLFAGVIHAAKSDGHKSDTDSGKGSIYDEKRIVEQFLVGQNKLRVTRCSDDKFKAMCQPKAAKVDVIGFERENINHHEKINTSERRPVVTSRKDTILRKRDLRRRNTIDLSHLPGDWQHHFDLPVSKTIHCTQNAQIGQKYATGASMPDLSAKGKFATFPKLNVRRCSRIVVGEPDDGSKRPNELAASSGGGAEFILNSSLPCQELNIGDQNCPHKRMVNVLLLNGRSVNITCSATTTTVRQVLETVLKAENLHENFFLGLCALVGGDFVFLPNELKVCKVASHVWSSTPKKATETGVFRMFLRIKFFLPNLREISNESRHLFYLQLRKSILENQILCTDDDLIQLSGFALQAEIGDFQHSMKFTDYFTVSHYLPEDAYQRNKEMAKYLRNSHFCRRGMPPKEAEQQYIRYVQQLKEYGAHLCSAIWTVEPNVDCNVFVAISLSGITLCERTPKLAEADKKTPKRNSLYQRTIHASFNWLEIENLCFSKHILYVVARKADKSSENKKIKYKFKMDDKKSYFSFHLASEHHKFYMKLRDSIISIQYISNELNIPLALSCVKSDIFPSDYEAAAPGERTDIKTIDKRKKSLLGENKILRLRDKLLRRSKSIVGMPKFQQPDDATKEEHQNKENEQPRVELSLSPSRNRVKMGTRVFSSQFLNKSLDNIYSNAITAYSTDFDNKFTVSYKLHKSRAECSDGNTTDSSFTRKYSNDDKSTTDVDRMSLKSSSLSSTHCSDRAAEMIGHSSPGTDAYVIQSCFNNTLDGHCFSLQNESLSETLLDKFSNMSATQNNSNDRIISRITIRKAEPANSQVVQSNLKAIQESNCQSLTIHEPNSSDHNYPSFEVKRGMVLGISVVQGPDNNVYVKDLIENGLGDLHGVLIGDQILAVNGVSLLNMPYDESLKLLQNTGDVVELTVSQIFAKYKQRQQQNHSSGEFERRAKFNDDSQKSRRSGNELSCLMYDNYDNNHLEQNVNSLKVDSLSKIDADFQSSAQSFRGASAKSLTANGITSHQIKCNQREFIAPDLPKVVGIIRKKSDMPKATKKYKGHFKYPVTPNRAAKSQR